MAKPPARARRSSDDRVARAARADALIARLESQVAHDAKTRARLLGGIARAGLVEPHRAHHAYALGADQVDCEFATGHARAMRGLMSIGPAAVAVLLEVNGKTASATHVTRLWPGIIATDLDRFTARGRAVDAKRLARPDTVSTDQQTVFEQSAALIGCADLHRDQVAYMCGADLVYCGLTANDALAMMGLMSIGPLRLATLLRDAAVSAPMAYVARLWPDLLAARRDDYEARGRLVRWQRRWARYNVDHAAWLASPRRENDDWRGQPMTAGQRHLVRDTATLLDLAMPEALDRGAAHDWLSEVRANILYRKET